MRHPFQAKTDAWTPIATTWPSGGGQGYCEKYCFFLLMFLQNKFFLFSMMRAWDFHPDVGLIMAGGAFPLTKAVVRSTDYGHTFTSLPEMPYGVSGQGVFGSCLVIIDSTTIFLAGGRCHRPGKLKILLLKRLSQMSTAYSFSQIIACRLRSTYCWIFDFIFFSFCQLVDKHLMQTQPSTPWGRVHGYLGPTCRQSGGFTPATSSLSSRGRGKLWSPVATTTTISAATAGGSTKWRL